MGKYTDTITDYIEGVSDYADFVDAMTEIRFGLERKGQW
jgi:hypothetical protein